MNMMPTIKDFLSYTDSISYVIIKRKKKKTGYTLGQIMQSDEIELTYDKFDLSIKDDSFAVTFYVPDEDILQYKSVIIYSDGSSKGNPGPSGYGTIVQYLGDTDKILKVEEFSEGFDISTNSRMELLGSIIGLESLEYPSQVTVYSDSKYLVDAFSHGWVDSWLKNGWKTSMGKPVANQDLWNRLLGVKSKHQVNFIWVKGHADNTYNERCDLLATSSADKVPMKKENGKFNI